MTQTMTLGEILKNRRNEIGRSIEQMAALTRIHAKTLQSIEEDRYVDLPARTFTRGFIVSYTKALGLNPNELLESQKDFLEIKFSERPSKETGHQGYAFEGKELEQNRRWLIIGAAVAAFFAIIVLLLFKPDNHKRKEKHKEFKQTETTTQTETIEGATGLPIVTEDGAPVLSPTVTATTNPAATASATASTTPVATTTPKPSATPTPQPSATAKPSVTPNASATPNDPLKKGDGLTVTETKRRVLLEAKDDVWVRYQSDQNQPMLILLRKGKFLVIKGKEKVVFEASTASALNYKTRAAIYQPLPSAACEVADKGALQTLDGGIQNAPSFPLSIPKSPSENR